MKSALAPLACLLAVCNVLVAQEAPRPNRHPLLSIFPDPLPDGQSAITMEASSHFLRPDFETGDDGRTFARFDGEDWGLTLDLARRFGSVVLNLRMRGVWRSGGWADQLIANWHDILGVPQGGRNWAPKFRLHHTLVRDGQLIAELTKDRASYMDTDLSLLYPFGDDKAGGRVGVSVQAPTGSRGDFSGNGSWDGLVGLALWRAWGNFRLHGQFEYAFLGVADHNPYSMALGNRTQVRAWAGAAYQGGGSGIFSGLGLDITVSCTDSPYSVGIPRIDRPGWQQHWSFSHSGLPQWRMGISEEAGTYTAPDLSVFISYRFSN